MIEPDSETYRLLYCDDDGELIMLDEVQLMEPIPAARIEPLRLLLHNEDLFVSYQATLVLTAWADPVGVDAAANHIRNGLHQEQNFSPHQIWGVDTIYDEMAYALAYGLNNADDEGRRSIRQTALDLLKRYENHYFRSGMQRLMGKLSDAALLPEMTAALKRSLATGDLRQSSELLEPISRTDPSQAWDLIDLFRNDDGIEQRAQANVCDALAHIQTAESRALLNSLLGTDTPGVKQAAENGLKAHDNK